MFPTEQNTAIFYGFFYNGAADAARSCKFLAALIEKPGAKIIDISAGVGDLSFPLAGMGHYVTCFEECEPMYAVLLDRYNAKKDIRHLISLFPLSLQAFPVPLHSDMAVACNVFSHLDEAEKRAMISSVHAHLAPRGKFVFNCAQFTPFRPAQPFSEINKKVFGDMLIRHFASSSPLENGRKQTVRFEYRMEFRGEPVKSISDEFILHMDSVDGTKEALRSAGFGDIQIFGSYEGIPYAPNLPGFVIVASKGPRE